MQLADSNNKLDKQSTLEGYKVLEGLYSSQSNNAICRWIIPPEVLKSEHLTYGTWFWIFMIDSKCCFWRVRSDANQIWSGSLPESDILLDPEGVSALRKRTIEFTGQFQPVERSCNALLPSGKLCPRRDRIKVFKAFSYLPLHAVQGSSWNAFVLSSVHFMGLLFPGTLKGIQLLRMKFLNLPHQKMLLNPPCRLGWFSICLKF